MRAARARKKSEKKGAEAFIFEMMWNVCLKRERRCSMVVSFRCVAKRYLLYLKNHKPDGMLNFHNNRIYR